jgi:hypothetical protein
MICILYHKSKVPVTLAGPEIMALRPAFRLLAEDAGYTSFHPVIRWR